MKDASSNSNKGDGYEPKRSTKISKDAAKAEADGDVWEENLVACESEGGKMVIRSYFLNSRTGKREWDEPPTGASHIKHASQAERQFKEEEILGLEMAIDAVNTGGDNEEDKKKKKKGIFSAFLKKGGGDKNGAPAKGGMFGLGKKKGSTPTSPTSPKSSTHAQNVINAHFQKNSEKNEYKRQFQKDGDEELQRAIMLSMGLGPANSQNANTKNFINNYDGNHNSQEELDMAKAISLSMQPNAPDLWANPAPAMADPDVSNSAVPEEDEMLKLAIQMSEQEASGATGGNVVPPTADPWSSSNAAPTGGVPTVVTAGPWQSSSNPSAGTAPPAGVAAAWKDQSSTPEADLLGLTNNFQNNASLQQQGGNFKTTGLDDSVVGTN